MSHRVRAAAITAAEADGELRHRWIGLMVVSLTPALFWTSMAAGVGAAVGHSPAPEALTWVGVAIAAFCAIVTSALLTRH